MNISEMHVWVRQYAQQMGMQNFRAILPEQIDSLINTSITDIVNEIIRKNIGVTSDRIITDNSKIGQINALKYLYKVVDIPFQETSSNIRLDADSGEDLSSYSGFKITINSENNEFNRSFSGSLTDISASIKTWLESLGGSNVIVNIENVDSTTNIKIFSDFNFIVSRLQVDTYVGSYNETTENPVFDSDEDSTIITTNNKSNFKFKNKNFHNGLIKYKESLKDYLFLVDFSIDYSSSEHGFNESTIAEYNDNFETNLFPIRLIDDSFLADTLNDFILKPSVRSPIMVIYNNQMDIYLGKLKKSGDYYTLDNGLVPKTIRMSYVDKPAKVKYSEDLNGENVDCDLPEYMHIDILKHAVDIYNATIAGNLQAAQQQAQNQARENIRNNQIQEQ